MKKIFLFYYLHGSHKSWNLKLPCTAHIMKMGKVRKKTLLKTRIKASGWILAKKNCSKDILSVFFLYKDTSYVFFSQILHADNNLFFFALFRVFAGKFWTMLRWVGFMGKWRFLEVSWNVVQISWSTYKSKKFIFFFKLVGTFAPDRRLKIHYIYYLQWKGGKRAEVVDKDGAAVSCCYKKGTALDDAK